MEESIIEWRAKIFGALADPARLRIIELLKKGERSVCDIFPSMGKSQPATSKHLDTLRKAGILTRRVDGKRVIYKIGDETVFNIINGADRITMQQLTPLTNTMKALQASIKERNGRR